ncbi:hypothetical protein C9I98_08810 [Photobacterium sanctipauli]|uniref:Lipoprotein n=1 Tax=Photobacterium sanctipauli TaxID=1342794 RepID=A0A2T3NVA0_9GAMM|nr:hypothetical protein [Photobacterium sanctipauli]PSW20148.1 hypothetical protein C9I98_08810 [Photobacterium sanctipauli]
MVKPRILVVSTTLLVASCVSDLYSKPAATANEDISTLSEAYVKATRGGVLDFTAVIPGKVFHPRDGYIRYERLWCLNEDKGSIEEYLEFMEAVCEQKDGVMDGEWCVSTRHQLPLFSATIEQNGTTCTGGDLTTIINTIEPISSATSSEWRATAQAFGFQTDR